MCKARFPLHLPMIHRFFVRRIYLINRSKLKVGRLSRELNDACLQFWGGMGFTQENIASQFYRDSRLGSIGGGCDEVMLQIIAKYMQMI